MLATLNLQLALPEWPDDAPATAAQLATGELDIDSGFSQQLRLRVEATEPSPIGGGVFLPKGGSDLPVLPTKVLDEYLLQIAASPSSGKFGLAAAPFDITMQTAGLAEEPGINLSAEFTASPQLIPSPELSAWPRFPLLTLPPTATGQLDTAALPVGKPGEFLATATNTRTPGHQPVAAELPQGRELPDSGRHVASTQASATSGALRALIASSEAVPATSAQAGSRDGTVINPSTGNNNVAVQKAVSAAEIPAPRAAVAARTDELLYADAVRATPNAAGATAPDRRPSSLTPSGQRAAIEFANTIYPRADAAAPRPGILAELQWQSSVEASKDLRQSRNIPRALQSHPASAATEVRNSPIDTTGLAGASDHKAIAQTSTDLIATSVRDPAWGDRLNERVLLMAGNQQKTAEIRLTPAELGPLRVTVAVDDRAAHVTFHAQHGLTRDAIEQALPRLREMLAENGISLGQANVGEQGVAHGGDAERDSASFAGTEVSDVAPDSTADLSQQRAHQSARLDGRVDTFA